MVATCGVAGATTTIDPNDVGAQYAYGANTGWVNMEGDQVNGVVIGEYTCSGYAWATTIGWINFGDGSPANGIRYQNASASDFGVNLVNYVSTEGKHTADLRGNAYSPNIGWIAFEVMGNPRINFQTGELEGHAWSANTGWIALEEIGVTIATTLQPSSDSDGDSIGDSYEYDHAGGLQTMTELTDSDGDGVLDTKEYEADTDPFDATDRLQILSIEEGGQDGYYNITFTTKATRVYQMQANSVLDGGNWTNTGGQIDPTGVTFTTIVPGPGIGEVQFWRTASRLPLQP